MIQEHVAVIGAGIVGLAHAWSAAERGHSVTVFERSPRASGASIRNFGMVWPIGQPHGELFQTALLSRQRWLQAGAQAGISVRESGSIHLAHHRDEWELLQEFTALAKDLEVPCELVTPSTIHQHTPGANPSGLLGGLHSPSELCVNPREATRSLPAWLSERFGVQFYFQTPVTAVEAIPGSAAGTSDSLLLMTSDGSRRSFNRVILCCGAEFHSLFPAVLARSGLSPCKLQMLSVRSSDPAWQLGPHLASGLTLRHYRLFEVCPSLATVRARVATETPELDRFGIHVMVSQNNHGELILGDSHEYGDEIEPFDKAEIDELILRELHKVFHLPSWTIAERWHGIYAKHPRLPVFQCSPLPGLQIFTGTGGAGMTMSFGLAEQFWNRLHT
ncbi:MAG: TIGR03364 family FAD-dependent oxidoreductase [Planctomycetota bacterium]